MTDSARSERQSCGWLRHDWGVEVGFHVTDDLRVVPNWFRGVPDAWIGTMQPHEKVCGVCGKRKPLRWRSGLSI